MSTKTKPRVMPADVTSLDQILDWLDDGHGRNAAVREYVYALRDLQRAKDRHKLDLPEEEVAEPQYGFVTGAHPADHYLFALADAFDRLIVAEFRLNRGELLRHF